MDLYLLILIIPTVIMVVSIIVAGLWWSFSDYGRRDRAESVGVELAVVHRALGWE